MRVAVIGGGWFGCHLASVLMEKGCEVVVFEKNPDLFLEASYHNQCRLHLGFHYPRSKTTRDQIVTSFPRFLDRYEFCVNPVFDNLYGVARELSLVDFGTYCQVMAAHGLNFDVLSSEEIEHYGIQGVEGVVRVEERSVDASKARAHFRTLLGDRVRYNCTVADLGVASHCVSVNGEQFDWCLNCTYDQQFPYRCVSVFYEPTLMLLYRVVRPLPFGALTIMDGDLPSLYPFPGEGSDVYSLSAVPYTPIMRTTSIAEARKVRDAVDEDFGRECRWKFEALLGRFFPGYQMFIEYHGVTAAIKTKFPEKTGSRECVVGVEGKVIHAFSGKFNNAIVAEDRVCQILGLAG